MQPTPFTPWSWRDPAGMSGGNAPAGSDLTDDAGQAGVDLVGYKVEASDGHIGSIDRASYDVGSAYLVVDTGPWIFGRKVLLPAGTVQNVDHSDRKVYVDRTKDQIKASPEYDKETFETASYREQVGDYYTGSYRDYPR
ncbi:PRC-barrel domain-containing protein [Actinoplanes oblitus]|uniref:PRC-barrel domain-containing protein n=1 Tax=Actinoplanes oblitus TaxID=3040509 RepID=A0ABY8WD59_9ACTN|nr:PRC-barrel domain-containing protein [Actinoplanes oblitus]WIM95056.1 PRC-barrel domain-containing protein [Actinoplanes oblitus]